MSDINRLPAPAGSLIDRSKAIRFRFEAGRRRGFHQGGNTREEWLSKRLVTQGEWR